MKKRSDGMTAEDLDRLIEEITTDARGDDEQLWHLLLAAWVHQRLTYKAIAPSASTR
jgi:hypothetical protein